MKAEWWTTAILLAISTAPMTAGEQPQHETSQREASVIKSDEQVVLFPALASRADDGAWTAEVHGWIFEPERGSTWRNELLAALDIQVQADGQTQGIFDQRARAFVVDNERDKSIALVLGDRRFVGEPSTANGHFRVSIRFTDDDARTAGTPGDGPVRLRVALPPAGGDRRFEGVVYRVSDTGLSVICDIDDTVRVTGVGDREMLIRTTFFREFEPVPAVRERCAELAAAEAQFHYVSSSPWQLYEPLERFLRDAGFPAGSFHLKSFRIKDSTFLSLFDAPEAHKAPVIENLFQHWPRRRFVLIGDSGEKDPEIYGDLARRFPEQVRRIDVRDMKSEGRDSPRLKAAFRDVPPEKWTLISAAEKATEKP
jgi:hypothetical protein